MLEGVPQWPSNVLKLSKTLFADEIANKTAELDSSIQPDLYKLGGVVFRKVVYGEQIVFGELDIKKMIVALLMFSYHLKIYELVLVNSFLDLFLEGNE